MHAMHMAGLGPCQTSGGGRCRARRHVAGSHMLYYAMLCYAMLVLCCAVLCHAMPCCATLCYDMLCYAVLCYAMPCYATLRYAMLCYAMLWSVGAWQRRRLIAHLANVPVCVRIKGSKQIERGLAAQRFAGAPTNA